MFENEIAINQFQLQYIGKILNDIDDSMWYTPGAGHAHPPVWILGHLAVVGELGQKMLGGTLTHPEWLSIFGPGSSDDVEMNQELSKEKLTVANSVAYAKLQELCRTAPSDRLSQPHGISFFEGTPVRTIGNAIALLLTNHFAFHLSQLSSCRRSAGCKPLF